VPPLTPADRFRAWLVTGPLSRGAAFLADLAIALSRAARGKDPETKGR